MCDPCLSTLEWFIPCKALYKCSDLPLPLPKLLSSLFQPACTEVGVQLRETDSAHDNLQLYTIAEIYAQIHFLYFENEMHRNIFPQSSVNPAITRFHLRGIPATSASIPSDSCSHVGLRNSPSHNVLSTQSKYHSNNKHNISSSPRDMHT